MHHTRLVNINYENYFPNILFCLLCNSIEWAIDKKNKPDPSEAKIENIIKQLSLEEKIKMCLGIVSEEAFLGIIKTWNTNVKC